MSPSANPVAIGSATPTGVGSKFWAPRMRDGLADMLASDDDNGLKPLARKAAVVAVAARQAG